MGILGGDPQEQPMHYGEVFGVWSYLAAARAMVAGYQTFLNHAGDQDLVRFLEDRIAEGKRQAQEVEALLKANGVSLPPTPPDRARANIEDIPPGARFNDQEISASLGRDLMEGLVACSQIMAQCTREDIAMMFGQFHTTKAQFSLQLLRMNKEKGWLIPPPLHVQSREPAHI